MSAQAIAARSPGANIGTIYAFQGLVNASLWMPIWVVFLNTTRELSLGEVYLIAGVGWIVQAVSEVPTGAFADTYGRKVTLIVGSLVLALGLFLLAALTGFVGLLIAYLFWALGNALISGSDTALLYDSAVAAGREAEFPDMASTSFQILLGAQAIGSIAGGLFGVIDLRLPILATAALTVAAVGVLLRLSEPPRQRQAGRGVSGTLRTAIVYVRERPRLFALLTYAALLSGTAFFVPFVLFQPAMTEQGVAVGWLGVLFTALRLGALVGSRYGPRLIAANTLALWLLLIPALMIVGFVAVAGSQQWWLTLLAMLYLAAVNAAIRPATTTLLNRQVGGSIRATIISLQSLTMTLFIAVLHPAVGAVADRAGTAGAFILLAAVCVLPLALAFPLRSLAAAKPVGPIVGAIASGEG